MSDTAWDLGVRRDDHSHTRFVDVPDPEPAPGEVLLRVDRVGVTTNNVTYARLGDALRYWDFFPSEEGWGRVPLWGFADVVRSEVDGVAEGERMYGYLPTSSHLLVRPEVSDTGFRDSSPHRADLPRVYNVYAATSSDASYRPEHEDLQVLYRPLFITSFMLDDFLADNAYFGSDTLLISSASSKTSYGVAFCAGRRTERPRLVGLTSERNLEFTQSLGCYDDVVGYDALNDLDAAPTTTYVDVSGDPKLRASIHAHFTNLVHDSVVGMTHDDADFGAASDLPGPTPTFFFAPAQISKRRKDWGPGGIDRNYGAAWAEFAPAVKDWVDVKVDAGRQALEATWLEVLSGKVDPRVGHVIAL